MGGAGVAGFRSPPASVIELLPVDCGVWGPCREPELAGGERGHQAEVWSALHVGCSCPLRGAAEGG